jgi:formate-dependent nitrite reductase membrane component NrfD
VKHIEWGLLIVNYLFLGGLSAGLYFLAALGTLLEAPGEERFSVMARRGALLAPWPVMIGTFLLIFDLGRWYKFYLLMIHFRWTSPMSIGTWLLLIFNVASLLFLWSWVTKDEKSKLLGHLPAWLAPMANVINIDLSRARRALALAGIPLSIGVGIYTGVLLGAVQSRPFWNTNLVAQLFLVSALSTGCALLMGSLVLWRETSGPVMKLLYTLDVVLLILEFFIVLPYVIHGQLSVQPVKDALHLIVGGPFTVLFWVCFVGVGLLLPLIMEVFEILPSLLHLRDFHSTGIATTVTSVLVLFGGFLLRYIFVYAGQISAFN